MTLFLTAIDFDGLASAVLNWLGDALFFGTVLAGVTWWMIRCLGRRATPALESLLWSVVLIKFLVPAGPVFSLFPFKADERPPPFAVEMQPEDSAGFDPLLPNDADPKMQALPAGTAARKRLQGSTLAGLCYLACAAGLIIRRARRHRMFIIQCRALPFADHPTQRIAKKACLRLGVRRIPSVRMGGIAPYSFVTGFFRPILVLAHHHLVRPDEAETVILHEVAHLRRGDMIVRYLQFIAGSLLFFWPVVAWVNRRIDLAREYACDEWALRQGKLAAGEYARCLLKAMHPESNARLACSPAGLASNQKSMERRIDMILQFPDRSSMRKRWKLTTWALLLLWSGFALSGSAGEREGKHPATEEAVKERAARVYHLVAGIDAADVDGDGLLTYLEKDTYLVALAMMQPDAFMREFPYADRNQSGRLDYLEAYGVIRGITLIAYADRRPGAASETRLDLEFYHMALDAQEWLLEEADLKPSDGELDNIWSVLKRIQGPPKLDHRRKLDHGGSEADLKRRKGAIDDIRRFQELETNIGSLEARLAAETDPPEAAKLREMLGKLEIILNKLKGD